jgi:phosphate transport system permease protein
MSATALPTTSARRRRVDRIMRGSLLVCTVLAIVPLALILYYLLREGIPALGNGFFTHDPTGAFYGNQGGIRSAIFGTIEIVGLATVVSVPIGICIALYLTEYGKDSTFAAIVRYFVDVMTGVPSIVFGLFIYITLVLTKIGGSFAAWKGSAAIALLMLPIVARSAEVVLVLVPGALREAALALGAPRWRVVTRVVLPTALPGLVTGSLLAVARGMGETAPLLFTIGAALGLTFNVTNQMNALPLQIYNDLASPNPAIVTRAWGAALSLVAMVLILNLLARFVARRSSIS